MDKKVIILTKSDKNGGYCVAGIDTSNGKFIRLVSEDEESEYALFDSDITYEDGQCLKVMDTIYVKLKDKQDCWFQPENYIIDSEYYLKKIGTATLDQIKNYLTHQDYIFYNNSNSILTNELRKQLKKYSLLIVELDELNLWRDKFKEKRIMASFLYNNQRYSYIKITDSILTEKYYYEVCQSEPRPYTLNNVIVIFSLACVFNMNASHYKLIANIIEQPRRVGFRNIMF
ncbi:dual OB domain-containing protein [Inconstantimicrobium mannanitabidum]|uniref:Uncharacterized protein n=1 Tax=Inconstantimicrobium mannanitabidum TaxID=1604901 RepID=A0ACB5RCK9_9CLOT|nr:hypothetical protein [Clostridium sp. TW13]GKX66880.1 hypothetical protein rsdtw13_21380 [Clostridium sp. TW13]